MVTIQAIEISVYLKKSTVMTMTPITCQLTKDVVCAHFEGSSDPPSHNSGHKRYYDDKYGPICMSYLLAYQ